MSQRPAPVDPALGFWCERRLDFGDASRFHFEVPDRGGELVVAWHDFLTPETCERLCAFIDRHLIDQRDEGNRLQVVWQTEISASDPDQALVEEVRETVVAEARRVFGIEGLMGEPVALHRMEPGTAHTEHADNADYVCPTHGGHFWGDEDCREGAWIEMSDRGHRQVSAVLYLNASFRGGRLVFPQHRIGFQPRTGLLLLFPGNRFFLHRVAPITEGTRYFMAIWMYVPAPEADSAG